MERPKPALIFFTKPRGTLMYWQGSCYLMSDDAVDRLLQKVIVETGFYSSTSHDLDDIEIWSIAEHMSPSRLGRNKSGLYKLTW